MIPHRLPSDPPVVCPVIPQWWAHPQWNFPWGVPGDIPWEFPWDVPWVFPWDAPLDFPLDFLGDIPRDSPWGIAPLSPIMSRGLPTSLGNPFWIHFAIEAYNINAVSNDLGRSANFSGESVGMRLLYKHIIKMLFQIDPWEGLPTSLGNPFGIQFAI